MDRRRMMMQSGIPSWEEYVQDGLVFLLDGIDKGATSGWTDLITGIRFTGSATKMDNCFSFNGTSNYFQGPSNSMRYLVRDGCTIEVCFSQNNTGTRQIFGQGVEGAIAIQTASSRNGISIATCGTSTDLFPLYTKSIELNKKYSISANIDSAIINNEELQKGEIYNMTDVSNIPFIGARKISTIGGYFGGKIYSIRIYNRRLSIEEMLHNQQIDNKRFNLGL